ncbi:hypothetical protein [Idiomarina abyssalis]|uniref:Uncharacterized protein n=1 Tax=Idiomarina abyssalis TaxID=86102 RepID=A0A8I1G973_9GAMM|nr:hypothetical protein [Idiomarina abyssalis]MBJ7266712.1 hypothetical protein [Idiomarina abyssalis]MBJ7273021.1 hypothetical protein [Idiomarina abyssalis]MBJ7315635.1 hypothetical protein [Idiomarina abyssalis]
MDKISSSLISFTYASVSLFVALGLTSEMSEAQETGYSDCSYIEFDDVDPSTLTLQERIALEEAALFASLDESAECMEAATASAADNLAEAAAGSSGAGGASGSTGSSAGGATGSETQQQSSSAVSESSSVDTKDHKRGNSGSGSSAVCDAVKEGMASATTEAEKEHFKGLMAEYGCQ